MMNDESTQVSGFTPLPSKKILALVSDAFGGHGGIATFNRGFLTAIAAMDEVAAIRVLPRLVERDEPPPAKIIQENDAAGGIAAYFKALLRTLASGPFDLVICGHVNLLPFARLAQMRCRCPLGLVVHGIDVQEAANRLGLRYLARRVDLLISVSGLTRDRFVEWAPLKHGRSSILPNCVDLERFTPGPRSETLLDRYGLRNKQVLMTFGRLAGRDRQKGFDEVLEVLPELLKSRPDMVYLIVGDGPDRQRLQARAQALGVEDAVVFAGRIAEEEKVDHYRLADLYVMPSRGEGFGIVILEALACGIPVIGSRADGTREALLDGRLGELIDPTDPAELMETTERCLKSAIRGRPAGLETFSGEAFVERTQQIIHNTIVT
jgi:glycosyltransferase involved in cell wall biosynthesis